MTTALELWDKLRQQPSSWVPSERVWAFVLTDNERLTMLNALRLVAEANESIAASNESKETK